MADTDRRATLEALMETKTPPTEIAVILNITIQALRWWVRYNCPQHLIYFKAERPSAKKARHIRWDDLIKRGRQEGLSLRQIAIANEIPYTTLQGYVKRCQTLKGG